jgi:hypothetical protein
MTSPDLRLEELRVPVEAVEPIRVTRRAIGSFTRVAQPAIASVARCRTGRAAALYLLLLRHQQLEEARAIKGRRPAGTAVRIPTADRAVIGLGDERAMRRATQELVDLGLVRRILRPGRASLLELVHGGP